MKSHYSHVSSTLLWLSCSRREGADLHAVGRGRLAKLILEKLVVLGVGRLLSGTLALSGSISGGAKVHETGLLGPFVEPGGGRGQRCCQQGQGDGLEVHDGDLVGFGFDLDASEREMTTGGKTARTGLLLGRRGQGELHIKVRAVTPSSPPPSRPGPSRVASFHIIHEPISTI